MTPEQRKRVAEILTGQKWKVVPWRPVNPEHNRDMILLDGPAGWSKSRQWKPKFDADTWQRSQALAVVKKTSDILYKKLANSKLGEYDKYKEKLIYLAELVYAEDIENIMFLLLELRDEINSGRLDVEGG